MTGVIERPNADILILLFRLIVTGDKALVIRINDVPVARIREHKPTFAAARLKPVFASDHAALAPTGDSDIRVVLLRTIDVVGERVVHRDMIELGGRLILQRRPTLPSID